MLPISATCAKTDSVHKMLDFLQELPSIPELPMNSEHFVPSALDYGVLQAALHRSNRSQPVYWDAEAAERKSLWQAENEPMDIVWTFERRNQQMAPENSRVISDFPNLIEFVATIPTNILKKMAHRYVGLDFQSSDADRWGRPRAFLPVMITLVFTFGPPEGSPAGICSWCTSSQWRLCDLPWE